ncbi:hypothetical protein KUTeg_000709 [Tegillarca granosa]|uniref:Uncharacterized protein n=1 Tax=Tegillarca granosa TaxID=220873 RepID=A0ABQ9FYA7_TEGGR|nr:hypothetical protein KUTeg_000709 [Tegillarca granosa]
MTKRKWNRNTISQFTNLLEEVCDSQTQITIVTSLPSNNVLSMLIQQDKLKQRHNFCDLSIKTDKKIKAEFY